MEEFQVPPGVTEIQLGAFSSCKRLRRITLNENLEILEEGRGGNDRGRGVFEDSGIEEIMLPRKIRRIGHATFDGCRNLRVVYVENGIEADVPQTVLSSAIQVLPLPDTVVRGVRIWDLKALRDVIIPDGAEEIGRYWFRNSQIESVAVPDSVKWIQPYAFANCQRLRRVTFQTGSELQIIGNSSFSRSALEEVSVPRSVQVIEDSAF